MAEERTVLNPVLRLLTEPATTGVTGRGKDASKIVTTVYAARQKNLAQKLADLSTSAETRAATHGDRVLLWAKMDKGSQATTHTPDDLFKTDLTRAQIVAAWRDGYIIEFSADAFTRVANAVASPRNDAQRCDIFRVEDLALFASVLTDVARAASTWEQAATDDSGRRSFQVRLPSFLSEQARRSVLTTLVRLAARDEVALPASAVRTTLLGYDNAGAVKAGWIPASRFEEEAAALMQHTGSFPIGIRSSQTILDLVASGAITKWEPVSPLVPVDPGEGPEPDLDLPNLDNEPIVGIFDGGYHASRYRNAIAWRHTPSLVPDHLAARDHGNKVTSLVVDGHRWSNQLNIPALHCRVGVVQMLPQRGVGALVTYDEMFAHVERAFRDHPEVNVWNLSANIDRDCDEFEVSEPGHRLSQLCRLYNKLLVISAGNRGPNGSRVAPPSDCEAGLIVSGRENDGSGNVGGACSISRMGLGPEGMLVPEISWFSRHRVLGGATATGTSFAAPLVARLAAHTWQNIKQPTPDQVKALLLSACDLEEYSAEMGFGSPISPEQPWICASNAAVLIWSAPLITKRRYYWTGIRIPPSLITNGRFVGRAKLVTVHEPVVQTEGHHYCSTRLEAQLQYVKEKVGGGLKNEGMLGCLNPAQREVAAREHDHKWDPVHVYSKSFTETNGPKLVGAQPALKVYARTYWRNDFLYSPEFINETETRASFVVVLESEDPDADTYNEFRRIMAENVTTASVEEEVEISDEESDD